MTDPNRADALLADLPAMGRGRLKVFLGAAPGVGKTYAMLLAAQSQLRQGVKLRVGIVETHGRAETEALLAGLPQQALKRSVYRGITLEEMDLDGLLADPPTLALVDELAHSNAPGSRHAKRWQDIQELLSAGIDVYTTVNVQHLESLNDHVRDITGVQVRETVPDWVLQEAYELLLVDLPPRELLERLREGKVYVPEQARAAIDAFFSQTNLTALRELAMQTAAARVDADLTHRYRQQGGEAPAVRGRLLVGVDGEHNAERLVRHASRVAERRHLPWSLVHVDTGEARSEESRMQLQSAQQLAERLGGDVVELRGGEVARTLVEHAKERRATLLLVGRSRQRWYRQLFGGAWRRACCAWATGWKSACSTARLISRHPRFARRRPGPGAITCSPRWPLPAPARWPGAWPAVLGTAEHLPGVPRRRAAGGGTQQPRPGAGLRGAVVPGLRLPVHPAAFLLLHPARRRRADAAVLPAHGRPHRQPCRPPAPAIAGVA